MNEKTLISIIVIFLNAEKFIEETIESIQAQTYEHWELLLVDDGSSDGSTEIAKKYSKLYPEKVFYLEHSEHQNLGMSAARNLGICNAKGEYIAFLDSDDVWLPLKLEQQVAILDAQPEAAMLYGRTQFWFSWTGNSEDIQRDCLTRTSIHFDQLINPPTQLIAYLENQGEVYPCMCSVLIRRRVFEEIGKFEEEFRNANEDMVFHSKVFLNAPIFVSSQCWDRYRIHPESYWQTTKKDSSDIISIKQLSYLNWLEKYLRHQQIKNPEVWRVLKRRLWYYRHPRIVRLSATFYRQLDRLRHPLRSTRNLVNKIEKKLWPFASTSN